MAKGQPLPADGKPHFPNGAHRATPHSHSVQPTLRQFFPRENICHGIRPRPSTTSEIEAGLLYLTRFGDLHRRHTPHAYLIIELINAAMEVVEVARPRISARLVLRRIFIGTIISQPGSILG